MVSLLILDDDDDEISAMQGRARHPSRSHQSSTPGFSWLPGDGLNALHLKFMYSSLQISHVSNLLNCKVFFFLNLSFSSMKQLFAFSFLYIKMNREKQNLREKGILCLPVFLDS